MTIIAVAAEKLSVLLAALSTGGRQDQRIRSLFNALSAEGHDELDCRTHRSWEPLVPRACQPEPMLILSGNAAIAVPKNDRGPFETLLERWPTAEGAPLAKLRDIAISHPMVFSKGDVIGAMDTILNRAVPLNYFFAGTFFKTLHTSLRLQLRVALLPRQSTVVQKFLARSVTEHAFILNCIASFMTHDRRKRINHIIACCLAGLLPAYRTFVERPDKSIQLGECDAVHAVNVDGRLDDSRRICLTRALADESVVGVEVSTLYLDRCFGFHEEADYAAGLNADAIVMCAPTRLNTIPQIRSNTVPQGIDLEDRARLDRICSHPAMARPNEWAPESVLFMLRTTLSAREYCSEYHVDFDHQLFKPDDFSESKPGPALLPSVAALKRRKRPTAR